MGLSVGMRVYICVCALICFVLVDVCAPDVEGRAVDSAAHLTEVAAVEGSHMAVPEKSTSTTRQHR